MIIFIFIFGIMSCGEMCKYGASWCAMTFEPHDPKYGLDRYVIEGDDWTYEDRGDSSVIVFTAMEGGVASIDRKYHLYPPMDRTSTLTLMVKVPHSPGRIMIILGVSSAQGMHGMKLQLDDEDTECWGSKIIFDGELYFGFPRVKLSTMSISQKK